MDKQNGVQLEGPQLLFVETKKGAKRMSEVTFNEFIEFKAATENRKGRKTYILLDALINAGVKLSTPQMEKLGLVE